MLGKRVKPSKEEMAQAIRKWKQERGPKSVPQNLVRPSIPTDTIIYGDNIKVMRTFPNNYFDTIITDPPYGLKFMGKKWDYDVPSIKTWWECLRVLKPGGTLLCFAGSRTQHRMAVNVEDAGFILKDCIMWLYGSGFPKATDISKQLDKGHEREVVEVAGKSGSKRNSMAGDFAGGEYMTTAPTTPEAILWNGWKSHGLKPAYEPILVAMKPNDGTYANNALVHGVSGLNIDGGRINHNEPVKTTKRTKNTGISWNKENCGLRESPTN
ncbi:MAG TPA: site-specific DNA-methyltransferase, partial [bacterium]|nr:site-specific DNA-methyltransferase [bacterium]